MNGLPYYKAYPRDFIEGTIGIPFELKGAYRLLLDLIYMQAGDLPDDPRYIAGLLGCSVRKWKTYREALIESGKIYAENGIISNFRADKELVILRKYRDNQAEKASHPRKNNELKKPRQSQRARLKPEPDTEPEYNPPCIPPLGEPEPDEPKGALFDAQTGCEPDHDASNPEVHAEADAERTAGSGPARDTGGGEADRRPATASAKPAKRRQQFPEDWWPTDAGVTFAEQHGCPDLAANVAACIDKHREKGNTFADLNAAWRTWCRNAVKYGWTSSRQGAEVLSFPRNSAGNQGKSARGAYFDRLVASHAKIGSAWTEAGDGEF